MPLAAMRRAVSATTSSGKNSNVKRLCARVMTMSGVRVMTPLMMRMRSQGSSRR